MLAQDGIHPFLQIQPFGIFFRSLGIDGVMAYYEYPVFLGRSQHRIHPGQLFVDVLLAGIGIFLRIFPVFVHQWGGINHDQTDSYTIVLHHLRVITVGHVPTGTHLRIVNRCLRIAPVFMVTQDGIPRQHQFRMFVNQFVVGHPKRVVHTPHPFEMVHITGGYHTFYPNLLGQITHQFGYRLLVVISVAAQIVCQQEVQRLLQGFPYFRLGKSHHRHPNQTKSHYYFSH